MVELAAGLLAGSTALLADSLDNLGDTLTYRFSLYAVSRGARSKANVAVLKGVLILTAGLFVLWQVAAPFVLQFSPVLAGVVPWKVEIKTWVASTVPVRTATDTSLPVNGARRLSPVPHV